MLETPRSGSAEMEMRYSFRCVGPLYEISGKVAFSGNNFWSSGWGGSFVGVTDYVVTAYRRQLLCTAVL